MESNHRQGIVKSLYPIKSSINNTTNKLSACFTEDELYFWISTDSSVSVYDSSNNGLKIGSFFSQKNQKICHVAHCYLKPKQASSKVYKNYSNWIQLGLYIATQDIDPLTGSSFFLLNCFDLKTCNIISSVVFAEKITCVKVFKDASKSLASLGDIASVHDHLILVGTEKSHLFVLNPDWNLYQSNETPVRPLYLSKLSEMSRSLKISCFDLSEKTKSKGKLMWPDKGECQHIDISRISVTALKVITEANLLAVGFNFGSFMIISLRSCSIVFYSELSSKYLPIVKFVCQEPENDPRHNLYLWILREKSQKKAETPTKCIVNSNMEMQQLNFGSKISTHHQTCYENLEVCSRRFSWQTDSLNGLSCMQSFEVPSGFQDDTINSAHHNEKSLVYFAWQNIDGIYGVLFDINGWYNAQMPGKRPLNFTTNAKNKRDFFNEHFYPIKLDDDTSEFCFTVSIKKESIETGENQYHTFSPTDTHHLFASTIGLKSNMLGSTGVYELSIDSILKNKTKNSTNIYGIASPFRIFDEIIKSDQPDHELFDEMFESKMFDHFYQLSIFFRIKQVNNEENNMEKCKLQNSFIDWCWQRSLKIKDAFDEQVFNATIGGTIPAQLQILQKLKWDFANLFSIYANCLLENGENRSEALKMVQTYMDVAFWFCGRPALLKSAVGLIHLLPEQLDGVFRLILEKLGLKSIYPPETGFHLINIFLQPNINLAAKWFYFYAVILFLFNLEKDESVLEKLENDILDLRVFLQVVGPSFAGIIEDAFSSEAKKMPNPENQSFLKVLCAYLNLQYDEVQKCKVIPENETTLKLQSLNYVKHNEGSSSDLNLESNQLGLKFLSMIPDLNFSMATNNDPELAHWLELNFLKFKSTDFLIKNGPKSAEFIDKKLAELLPHFSFQSTLQSCNSLANFPPAVLNERKIDSTKLNVRKSKIGSYARTPVRKVFVRHSKRTQAIEDLDSQSPQTKKTKTNITCPEVAKIQDDEVTRLLSSPLLKKSFSHLTDKKNESMQHDRSMEFFPKSSLPRKSILMSSTGRKTTFDSAEGLARTRSLRSTSIYDPKSAAETPRIKKFRFEDTLQQDDQTTTTTELNTKTSEKEKNYNENQEKTASESFDRSQTIDDISATSSNEVFIDGNEISPIKSIIEARSSIDTVEKEHMLSESISFANATLGGIANENLLSDDSWDNAAAARQRVFFESYRRSPLKTHMVRISQSASSSSTTESVSPMFHEKPTETVTLKAECKKDSGNTKTITIKSSSQIPTFCLKNAPITTSPVGLIKRRQIGRKSIDKSVGTTPTLRKSIVKKTGTKGNNSSKIQITPRAVNLTLREFIFSPPHVVHAATSPRLSPGDKEEKEEPYQLRHRHDSGASSVSSDKTQHTDFPFVFSPPITRSMTKRSATGLSINNDATGGATSTPLATNLRERKLTSSQGQQTTPFAYKLIKRATNRRVTSRRIASAGSK